MESKKTQPASAGAQLDTKHEKGVCESGIIFFHKVAKLMEAIIIALIPIGAAIDVLLILTANAQHLAKTVGIG